MAIKAVLKNGKKFYEAYVNGFDSHGRRIQYRKKNITTLRTAEQIEFELKRKLATLKEEKVSMRWTEWFNECVKKMKLELLPSTVMGYETSLSKWVHPHWNNVEINSITKSDVYDLIFTKCAEIPTQFTRRNILKMIKRIFQMAVEEGTIDRNPCTGISVKVSETIQKVLTNTEVEILLKEAQLVQHRFYPVWVVALLTGMRSGELFALKWSDIDFDQRLISVTKQWTSKNGFGPTKTRRNRIVPISEDLLVYLKERKLKEGTKSEFVLPRLGEWDHGEQAKVIKDFCIGLGITPIKFHDLRATFITNLLARGESVARVMSIVGHTELKTTNGYLRKAGIELHGATDKLGYKLPSNSEAKIFSIVGKIN